VVGIAIIQARPCEIGHKDVSGTGVSNGTRDPDGAGSPGRFDRIRSSAWTNARTHRRC